MVEVMSGVNDAQQQLKLVNEAIEAVLVGGQEYRIGSRKLTRADLKELYKMKNDLTAQINQAEQSSLLDNTYVAYFEGR